MVSYNLVYTGIWLILSRYPANATSEPEAGYGKSFNMRTSKTASIDANRRYKRFQLSS